MEVTQQPGLEVAVDTMSLSLLTYQQAHEHPDLRCTLHSAALRGEHQGWAPEPISHRCWACVVSVHFASWLVQPNKVLPSHQSLKKIINKYDEVGRPEGSLLKPLHSRSIADPVRKQVPLHLQQEAGYYFTTQLGDAFLLPRQQPSE